MTKFLAKLTGTYKYFKYLGKLVQALKILSNIIPQIMIFIPEEHKAAVQGLVETLDKIAEGIEKAEEFLNKLGINTDVDDEARATRSLEDNIKALDGVARGFVRITEHHR